MKMNIINDYINDHSTNEQTMNEKPTNESTMTIDEYGNEIWRNREGLFHRPLGEGPAIEFAIGEKRWYYNGIIHRPTNEGPAIVNANGDKYWYYEGKLHRIYDPAIEMANGDKYWYYEGKLHRNPNNGAAIEMANGYNEYFVHGKSLAEEDVDHLRNNQISDKSSIQSNLQSKSQDILIQSITQRNFDLFKQTIQQGVVVENWNLSDDPSNYDNIIDCVLKNNAPMEFLSFVIESLNNGTIKMDVNAHQGRILKTLLYYFSLDVDHFNECMKYKGFKFTFPANNDFESPIYKQCCQLGCSYLSALIDAEDYNPDYLDGYMADCLIENGDYSDFCKYLYPSNGKSPDLNISSKYNDTRNCVTYCVNQGRVNILGAMLKYQSIDATKQLKEIPSSAIYQAVVYHAIDPVVSLSMLNMLCEWMRKNNQEFYFDEYMAHILKRYNGKRRFVKFANHLTVSHLKLLDGLISTSALWKMINLSSNYFSVDDLNNRLIYEILQDMYERKTKTIITYKNNEYIIERKRICDCKHPECDTILLDCKPYKRLKF